MKRLLRQSLTFRLTLLFSSSATLVLLVLGLSVARSVNRHFVEQDIETLAGKLTLVRHAFDKVHTDADLAQLPEQLDGSLVGHHGLAVAVISADGKNLFLTHGVQFPESLLNAAPLAGYKGPIVWQTETGHYRGIAGGIKTNMVSWPEGTVAVATEISHHETFMNAFRQTMWITIAVAAMLLGFLGWVATRRGLYPLRQLIQGASEVTASRLHQRLPLETVPIELEELTRSLNDMLARLEESFKRLSDFSSDLAHELRTPISNLMMQTHVSLARSRSVEEYQEILSSNAEEFERMARMISDMLFLAKADNGLIVPSEESIKLEDEISDLFDFYEALAEASNVRLVRQGEGETRGDRLMLRRAFSNLLSNAIRYANPGSIIQVTIDQSDNRVQVVFQNQGETIPAEQLPRLLDRFFRGDASRHRTSEGAGLGLAITASIIKAHHGEMVISSNTGVTRVSVCLPQV